jgi:chemotaxis-related protein WspB
MMLIIFEAGGQTYGLDARTVCEVAPYPRCAPLPHAPAYVAGLATWRGRPLPVLDLSALIAGTAARPLLSTRLLVVEYSTPLGRAHPLGLVAEKAVETIVVEDQVGEPQQVAIADAPYLNGTVEHAGRLVLRLSLEELLPAPVRAELFPESDVGTL